MSSPVTSTSQLTVQRAFLTIVLSFVFLTGLIATLGVTAYRLTQDGTQRSVQLSDRLLPALAALGELQQATLKYNLDILQFVTGRDEETQARELASARQQRQQVDRHGQLLNQLLDTPETRTGLEHFLAGLKAYDEASDRLQTALKANEFDTAMQILDGDIAKHYAAIEQSLAGLSVAVQALSSSAGAETTALMGHNLRTTLWLSAGIGAVAVLAVLVVLWISRRISVPLQAAVAQINDFAGFTTVAAKQIAGSSQSLADGASQQAASLEESAASLEEMSSMTRRNAEAANNAKQIAGEARSAVDAGAGSMQRMTDAMQNIKASSAEIAKIIKTIDEIAFQTNILALNAAVEAARAGEAGAGFAVVAEEVRALAQRSAQAAKETAEKIEAALHKSDEGTRVSAEVSEMLGRIVGQVRRMDGLVAEIATASGEQSQGITQINQSVSQMEKITQGNAASAEESASAAQELSGQSEKLQHLALELRHLVGAAGRSAAAAAPAAATPVKPALPSRAKAASPQPATAGQADDFFA